MRALRLRDLYQVVTTGLWPAEESTAPLSASEITQYARKLREQTLPRLPAMVLNARAWWVNRPLAELWALLPVRVVNALRRNKLDQDHLLSLLTVGDLLKVRGLGWRSLIDLLQVEEQIYSDRDYTAVPVINHGSDRQNLRLADLYEAVAGGRKPTEGELAVLSPREVTYYIRRLWGYASPPKLPAKLRAARVWWTKSQPEDLVPALLYDTGDLARAGLASDDALREVSAGELLDAMPAGKGWRILLYLLRAEELALASAQAVADKLQNAAPMQMGRPAQADSRPEEPDGLTSRRSNPQNLRLAVLYQALTGDGEAADATASVLSLGKIVHYVRRLRAYSSPPPLPADLRTARVWWADATLEDALPALPGYAVRALARIGLAGDGALRSLEAGTLLDTMPGPNAWRTLLALLRAEELMSLGTSARLPRRSGSKWAQWFPPGDTLEEELAGLLATCTPNERQAAIVTARFGLDGSEPRTLEQAGEMFRVTRERVRQVAARFTARARAGLEAGHTLPQLQRAIQYIADHWYLPPAAIRAGLTESGISVRSLHPAAIIALGRALGLEVPELSQDGHQADPLVERVLLRALNKVGVGHVEQVREALAKEGTEISREELACLISFHPRYRWLGGGSEWYWRPDAPRQPLANRTWLMLLVGGRVHIDELYAGLARDHRIGTLLPPKGVYAELVRALPGVHVAENGTCELAGAPAVELPASVRMIARALEEEGGVATRRTLYQYCVGQLGMNPVTFGVTLDGPCFQSVGRGAYTVIGARPSAEQIDLAVANTSRVPTHVACAWLPGAEAHAIFGMLITVGDAFLSTGILGVPSQWKRILQGEWTLMTDTGTFVLKIRGQNQWGYHSYLRESGVRVGDQLGLVGFARKRELICVASAGRGKELTMADLRTIADEVIQNYAK